MLLKHQFLSPIFSPQVEVRLDYSGVLTVTGKSINLHTDIDSFVLKEQTPNSHVSALNISLNAPFSPLFTALSSNAQ